MGSSGPADIQPDGQQTMSWAATVPYEDAGFQFPPSKTLDALPPDGIVILVTLEQHGQPSGYGKIPLLSDFLRGSFEGIPADVGTRHFDTLVGHYNADMWVLFGQADPTKEQPIGRKPSSTGSSYPNGRAGTALLPRAVTSSRRGASALRASAPFAPVRSASDRSGRS